MDKARREIQFKPRNEAGEGKTTAASLNRASYAGGGRKQLVPEVPRYLLKSNAVVMGSVRVLLNANRERRRTIRPFCEANSYVSFPSGVFDSENEITGRV